MMKLTEAQYRALKFLSGSGGMKTSSDAAILTGVCDLIQTQYASVRITVVGLQAVAEYERQNAGALNRASIAAGMSRAGRAALDAARQEGGADILRYRPQHTNVPLRAVARERAELRIDGAERGMR